VINMNTAQQEPRASLFAPAAVSCLQRPRVLGVWVQAWCMPHACLRSHALLGPSSFSIYCTNQQERNKQRERDRRARGREETRGGTRLETARPRALCTGSTRRWTCSAETMHAKKQQVRGERHRIKPGEPHRSGAAHAHPTHARRSKCRSGAPRCCAPSLLAPP
jgi:hypothetical protein